MVGTSEGAHEGTRDGWKVGFAEGCAVGLNVGEIVGRFVSPCLVGWAVVGHTEGTAVVGCPDGLIEGLIVVGVIDGETVGTMVGTADTGKGSQTPSAPDFSGVTLISARTLADSETN